MLFKRAIKSQKRLRMALMGPAGSGKTYTALQFATVLAEGGSIALLDTERGSASLYSDRFTFDVCELDNFNPQHYINAIVEASKAGYAVLIIDSLSHAWSGEGGVLDQVNARGGNTFTDGWGKIGTPLQNRFMKAVLEAPMHVIATMRVKTEYAMETNEKGKAVPKRVGLTAVQRDGVEYEFDFIGVMNIENTLTIEKTRMIDLAGAVVHKPDGKLAKRILDWLSDGEDIPVSSTYVSEETQSTNIDSYNSSLLDSKILEACQRLNRTEAQLNDYVQQKYDSGKQWHEQSPTVKQELLQMLSGRLKQATTAS
jgi:hypothetical protein